MKPEHESKVGACDQCPDCLYFAQFERREDDGMVSCGHPEGGVGFAPLKRPRTCRGFLKNNRAWRTALASK